MYRVPSEPATLLIARPNNLAVHRDDVQRGRPSGTSPTSSASSDRGHECRSRSRRSGAVNPWSLATAAGEALLDTPNDREQFRVTR
jgi:hypothetical protein